MSDLTDKIAELRSDLNDEIGASIALQTAAAQRVARLQELAVVAAKAAALAGQTQPPPPPPPISTRVRSMWRFGWRGIDPATWPADVTTAVGHITIAMCQSAGPGTGRLTMLPSTSRAMVTALTARGVDVFAGIGGSGDGGITITSASQVAEALASITTMRDTQGITGVTLDLEGAPGSGWTVGAAIELGRAVVGAGMKVGIWSALYGGRREAWGAVAKALGDGLHHWQRGFYDFPEAADSRLTGIVLGDLAAMRPYVARDEQLVASFMPRPLTPYPNASPVPVIAAAYAAARAKYPGVGWSVWEDSIEAATGWAATRALAKL